MTKSGGLSVPRTACRKKKSWSSLYPHPVSCFLNTRKLSIPDSLARNFSKQYTSRNSLQNYRKMKMRRQIWIICVKRAAEGRLFLDVIVKKRGFATEASLQGFCLEWVPRFKQIQNTGNIMKYFKNISNSIWQEKGTSRTEVPKSLYEM